jgi:hypothetical protein
VDVPLYAISSELPKTQPEKVDISSRYSRVDFCSSLQGHIPYFHVDQKVIPCD